MPLKKKSCPLSVTHRVIYAWHFLVIHAIRWSYNVHKTRLKPKITTFIIYSSHLGTQEKPAYTTAPSP